LADPSNLLKTLDVRMLSVIKSAAIAFGSADNGDFADMSSGITNPLALPGILKKVFDELVGLLTRDVNTVAPERDQAEGLYSIPLAMNKGHRTGTREYLLSTKASNPQNLFIETEAL